ncbi:MAG TPA: hypothetical protein VFV95_14785 [Vicinamibacterales bacterium]|nr:hypothetical protein [Vicinamibacterales bacterium]
MKAAEPAVATICAALLIAASHPGFAHKPITSPFTFDEDVRPILQRHCVSCHADGGVAPMSLASYADTVPWAESMRVELVAGHMPPWGIEGGAAQFTNTKPLSARELNVLLTWAAGGTPQGTATPPPVPDTAPRTWPLGEPDRQLQPAREYVMAADVQDHVEEFTLETGLGETRWLRAVDVLPGDPTIVRSATVSLANPPAGASADAPLALWVPGDPPVPAAEGTGFELPAGARLTLRVHYKKTWQRERDVVRDRSTVGLYFTPRPSAALRIATLSARAAEPAPGASTGDARAPDARRLEDTWPWRSSEPVRAGAAANVISRTLAAAVSAHAIYANADLQGVTLTVVAVRPNGTQDTLITFRPQAGWNRRYWFREPRLLPEGTRIEVYSSREAAALLPPGAIHRDPTDLKGVQVALDVTRVN